MIREKGSCTVALNVPPFSLLRRDHKTKERVRELYHCIKGVFLWKQHGDWARNLVFGCCDDSSLSFLVHFEGLIFRWRKDPGFPPPLVRKAVSRKRKHGFPLPPSVWVQRRFLSSRFSGTFWMPYFPLEKGSGFPTVPPPIRKAVVRFLFCNAAQTPPKCLFFPLHRDQWI